MLEEKSLKIGDKVICNKSYPDLPEKGWFGEIIDIEDCGNKILVSWEKHFNLGHDGSSYRNNGKKCFYYANKKENVYAGWGNYESFDVLNSVSKQLEFNFK